VPADGGASAPLNRRGASGAREHRLAAAAARPPRLPVLGLSGQLRHRILGGRLRFRRRQRPLLVADAIGAWYSPTGHLLYTDRAGGLFAAPFDVQGPAA
jgi:hypothetical protein